MKYKILNVKSTLKYVLASVILVLANILMGKVFSELISIFETALSKNDFMTRLVILFLLLVIFPALLTVFSKLITTNIKKQVLTKKHIHAHMKLFDIPVDKYSSNPQSEYFSFFVNDLAELEKLYFVSAEYVFQSVLTLLAVLTIFLFFDVVLVLMMLVFALVASLISIFVFRKQLKIERELLQEKSEVINGFSNLLRAFSITKLSPFGSKYLEKISQNIGVTEKKTESLRFFNSLQNNLLEHLGFLMTFAVLFYLGIKISHHDATLKDMTFLVLLMNYLVSNVKDFLRSFVQMSAVRRVVEKRYNHIFVHQNVPSSESEHEEHCSYFTFKNNIVFENLIVKLSDTKSIKYPNFNIKKGDKILIKGKSGAGKSTLLRILTGGLTNYLGSIRIDDVDLKNIKGLYEKIAVLDQNIFLFSMSIKENIVLGRKYDEEKLRYAVHSSGLSAFLETLENGIETIISEDSKNLSGGEKRRIAIARTLYSESEIICFDEIDAGINEEILHEILAEIMKLDKTIIIISHHIKEDIFDKIVEV